MKKILSISTVFGTLVAPMVASAAAAALPASVLTMLGKATTAAWSIFAIAAVICFIYAGIMFLGSAGDPGKITKSKDALIWGCVGIAVAILAYSAVTILKTALGV